MIKKEKINYSSLKKNTVERKDARAIYAVSLARIAYSNLIFLDEAGFNEHTKRTYGYSTKNTKAYINVLANRKKNISLICAISLGGVFAFEHINGSFDSLTFSRFIMKKLVPYISVNSTKILIMDNARFHKSTHILNLLNENRIVYKFLVPYSPELNPIKELFAALKARLCGLRSLNSKITLEEAIGQSMTSEDGISRICKNFYGNMRICLEKARRRNDYLNKN